MKRFLVLIMLLVVLFPAFCSWELKSRETKDEFGDVISKDEYYLNGTWDGQNT